MSICVLGNFLTITNTNTLDILSKNMVLGIGKNITCSLGTTLTIKGNAYLPDMSKIYVGNNTTTLASTINTGLPIGCIMIWYNTEATIPAGWASCNGSNGTPDLRNLFIIGTDTNHAATNTAYPQGTTLGKINNAVTITTSHLPEHTHNGTTGPGGVAHDHSYPRSGTGTGNDCPRATARGTDEFSKATGRDDHDHTIVTRSTGNGGSLTILPPYYALIYIMKI
jgi:hypothetical protein